MFMAQAGATTLSIMTFSITKNEMRHSAYWHSSQIVIMLSVAYAECRYGKCPSVQCRGAWLGCDCTLLKHFCTVKRSISNRFLINPTMYSCFLDALELQAAYKRDPQKILNVSRLELFS
jgi:hypothetical protein